MFCANLFLFSYGSIASLFPSICSTVCQGVFDIPLVSSPPHNVLMHKHRDFAFYGIDRKERHNLLMAVADQAQIHNLSLTIGYGKN